MNLTDYSTFRPGCQPRTHTDFYLLFAENPTVSTAFRPAQGRLCRQRGIAVSAAKNLQLQIFYCLCPEYGLRRRLSGRNLYPRLPGHLCQCQANLPLAERKSIFRQKLPRRQKALCRRQYLHCTPSGAAVGRTLGRTLRSPGLFPATCT